MNSYALDKSGAKWLGVCAGLARTFDIDVVLVRIGLVLVTLFALGPIALVAYLAVALVADAR